MKYFILYWPVKLLNRWAFPNPRQNLEEFFEGEPLGYFGILLFKGRGMVVFLFFTLRVNMHRNLSYERSVATRWLAIAVNMLPYSSTQLPKQSYSGWASMELIKFLHDAYIMVNLWFTVWNGEPGSGHEINFDSGLLHTPWPASRNSYVKWYVPYMVERHSWASYVLLKRVM